MIASGPDEEMELSLRCKPSDTLCLRLRLVLCWHVAHCTLISLLSILLYHLLSFTSMTHSQCSPVPACRRYWSLDSNLWKLQTSDPVSMQFVPFPGGNSKNIDRRFLHHWGQQVQVMALKAAVWSSKKWTGDVSFLISHTRSLFALALPPL